MKVQSIILVALLCSATFAADTNTCSGILSSSCSGTNCQFTPDQTQTYCLSKCDGLSATDCKTNAANCKLTDDQCLPLVIDCNKIPNFNGTKEQCQQHNNACTFQAAVPCAPSQNNNQCTNLTAENACNGNTNCQFTLVNQSCAYNDSYQCNNTCDSPFCSKQNCVAKTACSGNTQAKCESNPACKFDSAKSQCNDQCPTNCNADNCTFTCQLDKDGGQQTCSAIKSDGDCKGNAACSITSTGTCAVKDGLCTDTTCNTDPTICQQPIAATCNNPTCSNDIKNCGANCFASPQVCIANNSQQCLKSFNTQQSCESQGCRFVQFGTCATKPNSNSPVIVFTLLSTLIAFMF